MQAPVPPPYPGYPQPYGGYPPGVSPYGPGPYGMYLPRPGIGLPRPVAVAPIDGTPFAVALVELRPTVSGLAVGSLITGIGSIMVSLVVGLFAALGARGGWGPAVAGAFAILATLLCAAAVLLHRASLRRMGSSVAWGPTRGRGMGVAGFACGLTGVGLTLLIMLAALAA